jgi:hypothetical protein
MKGLLMFGILVLLLVAAQTTNAQSVDDIINKYIDARGGKDKLDSIQSVYMEGTREMMGNEIPVRVTKVENKLSRTEFDAAGTTGFILITNKDAWTYIPMGAPSPVKLPDSAVANMQTELDIVGPLVNYAAKGNKAELLGKDTLDGNENYKIRLTTALGKQITFWIDAKTYLLTQTFQKGGGMFGGRKGNGDNETTVVYSNYSAVNGIEFAHTIETKTTAGGMSGSITLDTITINQPVDPKLYLPE